MANKIKILPDQVANQIAAGEVVERPASVVKELIENSLDAGAASVLVEVEQGGRRLIRVVDDGEGMSRDDALLCLDRHATSKIRTSRDLFVIHTLGFRGEALPSIASVCDLTMLTREQGEEQGTRIEVRAGAVKEVTAAGSPGGTEIVVRRLFYNVPASRKFLKSVETELGHITTLVSNMALARPDVHATLIHNGRVIFDLPRSGDLSGRLRHALGAEAQAALLAVDREFPQVLEQGLLRVHGFISRPSYTRTSTRSLHVFVNRRFVRDRLINHAVFEAYRGLAPKGRYPLVVLFIDLPVDAVDVNVHPAKHEVRFREQAAVHESVKDSILDALRLADRTGAVSMALPGGRTGDLVSGGAPKDTGRPDQARDLEPARGVSSALGRYYEKLERTGGIERKADYRESGARPRERPADDGSFRRSETGDDAVRSADLPGLDFAGARIIGQAAGTFILAESDDSLLIIDQHAAHERMMYEKIRAQFRSSTVMRQPLLFAETVELSFEEARRVEAHQETLLRLGLEVEPFGGNTVAVKALPALFAAADPTKLLLEVVDRLGNVAGSTALDDRFEEVFAVMACHSVVRASESMTMEEMTALVRAMEALEFPGHCPHGRDVVVRIRFRDLEKRFGR